MISKLHQIFILYFSCLILFTTSKDIFTAEKLHQLNRISSSVLSPDKKYIVYVNKIWIKEENKYKTNLKYVEIDSSNAGKNSKNSDIATDLTEPSFDTSDLNPVFSSSNPNLIFFLRVANGTSQIFYKTFPSDSTVAPIQLSNYELDVSNLKIENDIFLFSAEVYYDCAEDFACTKKRNDEIEARGPNTYYLYSKLMMRHWDKWYIEGKADHVFYQKVTFTSGTPSISEKPIDLVKEKDNGEYQSPPIENGNEQFSINKNKNLIAFSALSKNKEMSYNTKWDIFVYSIEQKSITKVVSEQSKGRCQNPIFNEEGTKLSFLCMERYGLESDALHLWIYDINSDTVTKASNDGDFKPAINSYQWMDGTGENSKFILNVVDEGLIKLYSYDFMATADAYVKLTEDLNAYGLPMVISDNTFYCEYSSFVTATLLAKLTKNSTSKLFTASIYYDPNEDEMLEFEMIEPEVFYFTGAKNEKVQGFIMKPINFKEGTKYPVAYLIHGGPEGAWDPIWSYRWNPNLWANHGFAVVMINPHGSSGMGIDFQDAVRNDWGGAPFEDIMLGLDYVLKNYNFLDQDRVGACGASYGGFMVNWIQGHNDEKKFKCLVTHDGVFSTITMFYATEEMWFPMSEYCPHGKWGCKPYNDTERPTYEKYNPEYFADHWNTPHLIIHGTLDYRIPVTEGISAFTTLQIRGIPSRFLHFKDENHWVLKPMNSIKWYEEVLGWLDKYLLNN